MNQKVKKPFKKVTHWPNSNIRKEEYRVDNKYHRTKGPAIVWYYENGNIEHEAYWVDGKRHRTNGSTFIWYDKDGNIEYESYYIDGKRHRTNGPAFIWYDKDGNIEREAYYVDDIELTKEEFEKEFLKPNKGYHKTKIEKGTLGQMSKVMEEVNEFLDAKDQDCKIMETLELSDIYGALEAVAQTYELTMDDLKKMSDITKKAFRDGTRK